MNKRPAPHNQSPAGGRAGKPKMRFPKPWEPSAEHMRWYELWAVKQRSYRWIGREVGRDHKTVLIAVRKVSEWIRQQMFSTVMEFRYRQTEALEEIAANALEAWQKSIGLQTVVTKKDGQNGTETITRTEESFGDPRYLTIAMGAMADIRKIWGVDKPAMLEVSVGGPSRGENLERVDGISRSEALKRRAELLLERAKRIEQN